MIRKKIFILLLIMLVSVALYGEKFIVVFKSFGELNTLKSRANVLDYNKHCIALINTDSINVNKLLEDRVIGYYEKPAKARAFFTPNDYYYSYQWDFDMLNMENVWNITLGSDSVIVGLLDTGVGYENYGIPSYEQNEVVSGDNSYHRGSDFNASTFVSGYDYIHDDTHPDDQNAHGTHVAGTIAEATDNSIGVAGMSPKVKIMPVQVLDYKGEGDSYTIAKGIYYACDNGADVINMSLGGAPGDSNGWHTVHLAIIHACSLNIPVVVAAGNDGVDELSYPAGFDETFSCGAVNYSKDRSSYSQYGDGLDFVMPGGDNNHMILQETFRGYDNGTLARVDSFAYYYYEGTSMAAPHLTAAIALMKSVGIININEIYGKLAYYSMDLGASGYDKYYGYGLPDVYAALTSSYIDNTPPVFTVYLVKNPVFTGSIDIWILSNEELMNGKIDSIVVANDGEKQVCRGDFLQDRLFAGKFRFASDGDYDVLVYGKDIWGNRVEDTHIFSLYRIRKSEDKTIKRDGLKFLFPKGVVDYDCIVRIENKSDGFSILLPQIPNKPVYLTIPSYDIILCDSTGNIIEPDANGRFKINKSGTFRFIRGIKVKQIKSGIKLISKNNLLGNLSIVSLSGRLVKKIQISNKREITIKGINKGIYFAIFQSNGNIRIKKRFCVW